MKSLTLQSDPAIQATLISILAEKKVHNALAPVQKLIEDENTVTEVKNVAKNSLHELI